MSTTSDQTQLKALLDSWVKANLAKNLDAIIGHYAADVRAFDAILQLQFKGLDAYRAHWQQCLEMCPGAMDFQVRELQQQASVDLGYGHFLLYCAGTDAEGNSQGSWMRVTQCYGKRDGAWKIVHDHFSAPFDPESGTALFGLTPDAA